MKVETPYRVGIWLPLFLPAIVAYITHGLGLVPPAGWGRKVTQLLLMSLLYGGFLYLPMAVWASWWIGKKPEREIRRLILRAPIAYAALFGALSLSVGLLTGELTVFATLAVTGAACALGLGYLYAGLVMLVVRPNTLAVLVSTIALVAPTIAGGQSNVSRVPIVPLNHVVLPAVMNGSSAWLILDPIRGVIVDSHWAARHGLPVVGGREAGLGAAATIGGAGSARREALFVRDLDLQVGGVPTKTTRIALALDSLLRESIGHQVDGLVGLDAFADRIVGVSMAEAQLTVHPRATFAPPDGAMAMPVRYDGGLRPIISVELELPGGRRVTASAYFDLGMSGDARLTTAFVDRIGLLDAFCAARVPAAADSSETGLGGRLTGVRTVLPSLTLVGAAPDTAVVATLARETTGADAAPAWDMLLGWSLMRRYDWWFDASGGRLWFRPVARDAQMRRGAHSSGVEFSAFEADGSGDLTVAAVDDGSAAAAAKVRSGDRILAIDGKRLRARDAAQAAALLTHASPRRLDLVRTNGTTAVIMVAPRMDLKPEGACRVTR